MTRSHRSQPGSKAAAWQPPEPPLATCHLVAVPAPPPIPPVFWGLPAKCKCHLQLTLDSALRTVPGHFGVFTCDGNSYCCHCCTMVASRHTHLHTHTLWHTRTIKRLNKISKKAAAAAGNTQQKMLLKSAEHVDEGQRKGGGDNKVAGAFGEQLQQPRPQSTGSLLPHAPQLQLFMRPVSWSSLGGHTSKLPPLLLSLPLLLATCLPLSTCASASFTYTSLKPLSYLLSAC